MAPGAVLLGAGSDDQGLLSYMMGADGSGADLLSIPAGGVEEPASHAAIEANRQFIQMDGRPVFKWAIRTVSEVLRETLEHAGPDDGRHQRTHPPSSECANHRWCD